MVKLMGIINRIDVGISRQKVGVRFILQCGLYSRKYGMPVFLYAGVAGCAWVGYVGGGMWAGCVSGYGDGCVLVLSCIVANLPFNCRFAWSSGSDLNPD